MEVWKDIVNYEGLYQVSNLGNVRNTKTKKLLKPSNRLYSDVDLYANGEHHRQAIHRLVALHFIPNPRPNEAREVNHKDGNKKNNNADNLEWVSQNENQGHAITKLHKYPFGKKPRAVNKIDLTTGKIIETFESISTAGIICSGNQYGRIAITNCCKGRTESAYGFGWQYANSSN